MDTDNSIPDFFQTLLMQSQIRNYSIPKLCEMFNGPVQLNEIDCYCVGKRNGCRRYIKIRILACTDKPLKGRHMVSFFNRTIYVESLTSLKSKYFKYEDKLSFERSCFILVNSKAVRLSLIRHIIQLPLFSGGLSVILPTYFLPSVHVEIGGVVNEQKLIDNYHNCIYLLNQINPNAYNRESLKNVVDCIIPEYIPSTLDTMLGDYDDFNY
jgi:hypothetical protein